MSKTYSNYASTQHGNIPTKTPPEIQLSPIVFLKDRNTTFPSFNDSHKRHTHTERSHVITL